MPLIKMKRVWDYCTYNKKFFLLVVLLFIGLNHIIKHGNLKSGWGLVIILILNIIIVGYGMTITRNRINNGVRLPKIMIKDVLVFGVKYFIVFNIFLFVQGCVLDLICSPFNFPPFELEKMLLDLPQTIHLLFTHDPIDTMIFIVLGGLMFYISSFFMEIAIARLADTGSIISAFNLLGIERDIGTMGWRNYMKDYTAIILAIVIFTYFNYLFIFIKSSSIGSVYFPSLISLFLNSFKAFKIIILSLLYIGSFIFFIIITLFIVPLFYC